MDNLGSYEPEINLFIKLYGYNFDFKTITKFITEPTISYETRNKRVKAFKRFYRNNIQNEHLFNVKLEEIDTLYVTIQDAPIELPITKDECLKVIKYLWSKKAEHGTNTDELKYKRLSLIVKTLYATGFRINELITITHKHIKTNRVCKISVLGKGTKARTIEIPMELYNEIKKVFNCKSDFLFHNSKGNILKQSNLFAEIKNAYNDCLSPKLKKKKDDEKEIKIAVGLHTHRHLFATELIKAGVPINEVSKKLGHASINITAKYYLHNTTDSKDIWSKLGI
jgi:site-specific recombinase XerD